MLFENFNTERIVAEIKSAQSRVLYVAPGIDKAVVGAICDVIDERNVDVNVAIDYSDFTVRVGFGEVVGLEELERRHIPVRYAKDFRVSILIVDDRGYVFWPSPRSVEGESNVFTNAMCLNEDQIKEILIRFSIKEAQKMCVNSKSQEEVKDILSKANEIEKRDVTPELVEEVSKSLKDYPPVRCDLKRQLDVFQSALRYVEMTFEGARLNTKTVRIPQEILKLGLSKDLQDTYRANVKLLDDGKGGFWKKLEGLNSRYDEIREKYLYSAGKGHGCVIIKRNEVDFKNEIEQFQKKIRDLTSEMKEDINRKVEATKTKLVDHLFNAVNGNRPKEVKDRIKRASFWNSGQVNEEIEIKRWIDEQLSKVMPTAEKIVSEMKVHVFYKDLTYETLTDDKFRQALELLLKDKKLPEQKRMNLESILSRLCDEFSVTKVVGVLN